MTAAPSRTAPADTRGIGRFGTLALLGWVAVVAGVVPFLLLWLLVQRRWAPLEGLDGEVAARLNDEVSGSPLLVTVLSAVTDLGGTGTAVLVLSLATAFLLIRRRRRLAAFVAVSGLGLAVLGPVTKAIVDRARPVVESPLVETPSNASFPSGHAMTALVTWGVLLLVALPGVRRGLRPWLVAGTVLLVVAVGFTRLALGVHFVSDVLAGWALGAAWLAVTTAAFRGWQHETGRRPGQATDPLDVGPDEAPRLAPGTGPEDHRLRAAALPLAGVALVLAAALIGLGALVTAAPPDGWLQRFDRSVVAWFAGHRGEPLNSVMDTVATLGGTPAVISVGLALATLSLAVTARWRPVVFVVVTLVGELLLYLVVSRVVDRPRPSVPDLTGDLPQAASWPSGHVAAAAAVYGALAAVVVVHGRARRRWSVLAVPLLLAPAVAVSRVHAAAHHPTDVLAGLLTGGLWVLACTLLLLRPRPDRPTRAGPSPHTAPLDPTTDEIRRNP
ncbi:PAP2 family protein [Blastococcus sp. TBT05-19]|uniref:phosphatase PAP2 family protein n=1 Tax=Blastococcus sp. TBT05-19 TaxID=2250581 RepID=UPI000DE88F15|nr:phosphatase PAP2 family protein [Blastococcus sp. TBT05-19]RBY90193.1 PAP2 family protein [Blastococcus sp. TBT05-19]